MGLCPQNKFMVSNNLITNHISMTHGIFNKLSYLNNTLKKKKEKTLNEKYKLFKFPRTLDP